MFKWTTEDGNIVGDAYQQTIEVDQPGSYTVEAINCIDCIAQDTVVVEGVTCSTAAQAPESSLSSTIYPVPARSGERITIEFYSEDSQVNLNNDFRLSASVPTRDTKQTVSIMVYDGVGRAISIPRPFEIVNGTAKVFLDLDYLPVGRYVVRIQGGDWSDAKNIIIR